MTALDADPYVRVVGADIESAIRNALDDAGSQTHGPDSGGEWTSQCPAHSDSRASLRWRVSVDGRGLVMCQAGCEYKEILAAMSLAPWQMTPTRVEYAYYDEHSEYLFTVVREYGADGSKGFWQGIAGDGGKIVPGREHVRDALWKLPELTEWKKTTRGGTLWLVEGEKDASVMGWALEAEDRSGDVVTSAPGGARKWSADLTADVVRIAGGGTCSRVVILCDLDPAGIRRGQSLIAELQGALGDDVAVVVMVPREGAGKDIAQVIDRYGVRGWEGRIEDASGSDLILEGTEGSIVTGGLMRVVEPVMNKTVLATANRGKDPIPVITGDIEVIAWWSADPGSGIPGGYEIEVRPLEGKRRTMVLLVNTLTDPAKLRAWLTQSAGLYIVAGTSVGSLGDSMAAWLRWQKYLTNAREVTATSVVGWVDSATGRPAAVAVSQMAWIDENGQVIETVGSGVEVGIRQVGGGASHCRWGVAGTEDEARWAMARILSFADPEVVAIAAGWAAATILGPWLAEAGVPIRPGLAVVARSGSGKSQPLSAPVLTPSGWSAMGDLGVGSMVIGSDGRATKVVGVYPQGEQDIYRVWFDDGAYADATADHLWYTKTHSERRSKAAGGRPGSVRTTSEIAATLRNKHGGKNHSIPLVAAADGDLTGSELPIGPYALGVLLGDGCFHEESVGLSSTDQQILDDFLADVGDARVRLSHCESANAWDYGVRGDGRVNPVLRAVKALGLHRAGSFTKFVPEVYKRGSVQTRLAVLRGLMDTDGWSGPSAEYGTCSERLAADVLEIVRSLGGTARVRTKTSRTGATIWTVVVRMTQCPFQLERKAAAWKRRNPRPPVRLIDRVELIGREDAQCILVDAADSLYVTNDWVLTHNTNGAVAMILSLAGCTGPSTTTLAGFRRLLSAGVGTIRWLDDSDMVEDPGMKELLRVATTRSEFIMADADRGNTATSSAELTGSPVVSAEGVRWLEEVAMADRFALVSPPNPQNRTSAYPGREGAAQWDDIVELTRERSDLTTLAGWMVQGLTRVAAEAGNGSVVEGLQKWIDASGGAKGRRGAVQAAVCAGTAAMGAWLSEGRAAAGGAWKGEGWGGIFESWDWLFEAAVTWRGSTLSETAAVACGLVDIVIPGVIVHSNGEMSTPGKTRAVMTGIDVSSRETAVAGIDAQRTPFKGATTTGFPGIVIDTDGRYWVQPSLALIAYQRFTRSTGINDARIVSAQTVLAEAISLSDNPGWAWWPTGKQANGDPKKRFGLRVGSKLERVVYHRLSEMACERIVARLEGGM